MKRVIFLTCLLVVFGLLTTVNTAFAAESVDQQVVARPNDKRHTTDYRYANDSIFNDCGLSHLMRISPLRHLMIGMRKIRLRCL